MDASDISSSLTGLLKPQLVFLQVLEDCGILQKIKRIAGSSAGAICAGLLAVGCTPQEIANVFKCDMKWLFHGKDNFLKIVMLLYFILNHY